MIELTQQLMKELFDYHDGNLYWKIRKSPTAKIGDIAGAVSKQRMYRKIRINYKQYLAHRLIFLYHHGYLPKSLDHIDGNKLNNDISNLREATTIQNQMNSKKRKSWCGKLPSSIYKGVSWNKRDKKWCSRITINGKRKHIGYFDSEIDAARAYDDAAIESFGEFARCNFDKDVITP